LERVKRKKSKDLEDIIRERKKTEVDTQGKLRELNE